jgi:hypothetical protein
VIKYKQVHILKVPIPAERFVRGDDQQKELFSEGYKEKRIEVER